MKVLQYRGNTEYAKGTVVEIGNTFDDLIKEIKKTLPFATRETIEVVRCGYDPRVGWVAHSIQDRYHGFYGICDILPEGYDTYKAGI